MNIVEKGFNEMEDNRVRKIVMAGLMGGIITVCTMFIKIPVPMTQGYVHLGDSMIFLAVLVLGKKYGAAAAGIGSALGDFFSGYPHWILWTLVIKFIMGYVMGLFLEKMEKDGKFKEGGITIFEIVGMTIAGCEMVIGYYIAASVMYGSWITPIASIPWNIGQFAVGMAIAVIISAALYRTPAKKYFAIK